MSQMPKTNTCVEDLHKCLKLLPDTIDKHTKSVKNWKSNTKSQWAPNRSNHSNCIIDKVFFVEYLFRCDWKVNRYLYVSYWQRYEWLKVIHNTVKIWIQKNPPLSIQGKSKKLTLESFPTLHCCVRKGSIL